MVSERPVMTPDFWRSRDHRNVALWAISLVAATVSGAALLTSRIAHDDRQLEGLAQGIADRRDVLAQRPAIDQRLARLQAAMARARTFGVTATSTPLAVSAMQTRLTTLITNVGGTIAAIQTTTTKSDGLRWVHAGLVATVPLARLQPLLDALGGLRWALCLTHLAIGHERSAAVGLRLALILPFFRTSP